MGGFFGVASKESCTFDLFFGTDYHSHLGTRRAGMAVYGENGFSKSLHNIENTPFRTKFDKDLGELDGNLGIGCISDFEAQPMLVRSHHGTFAITTVGKINNAQSIVDDILKDRVHFFEMSNGEINATELVAAMINQKDNFIEGMKYALDTVDGSLSFLVLTPKGIYAGRDKFGRTPVVLGKKDDAICACLESFSFLNLGYQPLKELEPGEIVVFDADHARTLLEASGKMKICTFLWVYYGYPSAVYEGVNVEQMRYKCGRKIAQRDDVEVDVVAGVPDSGTPAAIGYSNESGVPFSRPFIKYTPTWPRSFMPSIQKKREMIARMKLIPVYDLIKDNRLLLIDDSIVRGTQLKETAEFLFDCGAKEVHARPACPPIMFNCKYLSFSRSKSELDLMARRVICELEGTLDVPLEVIQEYADPDSEKYANLLEAMCKKLHFTSLKFLRLDDMLESVGIPQENLCTYCWNGKE